ncbi:MAG: helix-turn-helix domain-containing protein [Lachnospiraceae bacterium]|nr:helix-turn-helix domain-containing protein [Lachnospiraceae bacterium]
MQNLKPVIAKNISNLRQKKNMTQGDLASKLNYSDKAVSKWERAESIPDIAVLKEIADLFDVTLDYLVSDNTEQESSAFESKNTSVPEEESEITDNPPAEDSVKAKFTYISSKFRTHGFITGMCIILVWLIATLAFVVINIFANDNFFLWLPFLYAIPISAIVWLVFNSIWFNKRRNYFIISLLMWSTLISFIVTLFPLSNRVCFILLLGIPGQVIIYMWSNLKKKVKIEETK